MTKSLSANSTQMLVVFVCILIVILIYANNRIDSIQNQQYQPQVPLEIAEAKFPVQTLDLRDTVWESNKFSGTITNNGTEDIFNAKIKLSVSKSRSEWMPEDQFLTIPYKIKSGEKLEFSETMPSYDSSDWWSSNIVDAQYYNGEYVPTPASTVFPTPTVIIPPFIAMTPTPMPTQIPTPTPNLNKIFALKMLNERIIQITQEINFHNSVIKSLIDEEGERCDRPLSILKDGQIENPQVLIQCFNDYSSRIKEEQAKRDALIRERNAFEREAAQIIAQ